MVEMRTITGVVVALGLAVAAPTAARAATPSPTAVDFGGQSMQTTAPAQAVTIINAGTLPEDISSVTVSTYFAVTHNCATLPAGASCTANVTFTPTAQGPLNGTLTIQSAAGAQTVPLAGIGERSLATHYYRSILRRAPEADGNLVWDGEATRMAAIGANVSETWYAMANSLFSSAEYAGFGRTDAQFVFDLYGTFVNRPPDADGLAAWTGQLAAGTAREVLRLSFMFSPEAAAFSQGIFGNAVVRPEVDTVTDFYRGMLGRLPDDAGFNFWLQQFRAAQCGGAAAVYAQVESISRQFALGVEYAARIRTNAQYVGDLYNAFLRRGGDAPGIRFWIGQLDTGAMTREYLRMQFIASAEFTNRVDAIIAQGCLPPIPTGDVDVSGTPIPQPTAAAGSVGCENNPLAPSPGQGGGPCGAWRIQMGNCSTGMTGANAMTMAWQYNMESYPSGGRVGNSWRIPLRPSEVLVYKFRTDPEGALALPRFGGFTQDENSVRGPWAGNFMALSTTRCDFDYAKLDAFNACYKSEQGPATGIAFRVIGAADPDPGPYVCTLRPNTDYYLSIRQENARGANRGMISCNPAAAGSFLSTCGISLAIQ